MTPGPTEAYRPAINNAINNKDRRLKYRAGKGDQIAVEAVPPPQVPAAVLPLSVGVSPCLRSLPTLILHGTEDEVVPIQASQRFAATGHNFLTILRHQSRYFSGWIHS